MTPAGPAVCPHTANRPENGAGRAAGGARNGRRTTSARQKTPRCRSDSSKQPVFQQPASENQCGLVVHNGSSSASLRLERSGREHSEYPIHLSLPRVVSTCFAQAGWIFPKKRGRIGARSSREAASVDWKNAKEGRNGKHGGEDRRCGQERVLSLRIPFIPPRIPIPPILPITPIIPIPCLPFFATLHIY